MYASRLFLGLVLGLALACSSESTSAPTTEATRLAPGGAQDFGLFRDIVGNAYFVGDDGGQARAVMGDEIATSFTPIARDVRIRLDAGTRGTSSGSTASRIRSSTPRLASRRFRASFWRGVATAEHPA